LTLKDEFLHPMKTARKQWGRNIADIKAGIDEKEGPTIPQQNEMLFEQNEEIIRLLKRIDRRLELKWPMLLIGEEGE
jgi:hypothetical protein